MYVKLMELALKARESSYSPYSGFSVGAAIKTKNGKIYTGCNIENASFSLTCCAERTAIFKAVSDGFKNFDAIAIVGGKLNANSPCMPCGACLQVMAEFCPKEFKIILKDGKNILIYSLSDLLPKNFSL